MFSMMWLGIANTVVGVPESREDSQARRWVGEAQIQWLRLLIPLNVVTLRCGCCKAVTVVAWWWLRELSAPTRSPGVSIGMCLLRWIVSTPLLSMGCCCVSNAVPMVGNEKVVDEEVMREVLLELREDIHRLALTQKW
jgi:hypothetical protein